MSEKLSLVRKKKARKVITLNVKLEVLNRLKAGEKLSGIASAMGLAVSTIGTIRSNKEKIEKQYEAATPSSVTNISRHRSVVMEKMEKLLSTWIQDKNQRNSTITGVMIKEKAKSLFNDLKRDVGESSVKESFTASKGWFEKFKKRHQLRDMKMGGEISNADVALAENYPDTLKKIISEGGYTAHQVFNVDETVLYWKRMPEKTCNSSREDRLSPEHKDSRERLTLLLGGNAAGDFKLKPLLVYYCENPKAMKCVSKNNLPVIWRSNNKAWVTKNIFENWLKKCFCPAVENYCTYNNFANKTLLLLDNAVDHLHITTDASVRVEYLPKNTAALIQPMEQGPAVTFKAHYLLKMFQQLIEGTEGESCPTIGEFWNEYNIKDAVDNIGHSWMEVKASTMNYGWKKIWPECINVYDPQVERLSEIREYTVSLAKRLHFEDVTETEVIDWLESHDKDISNEELLQSEQIVAIEPPVLVEGKTKTTSQLTTKQLFTALTYFETGLQILTDNDPLPDRSQKVARGVNEAIKCYKQLYQDKKRESKKLLLDTFFQKILTDGGFSDDGDSLSSF